MKIIQTHATPVMDSVGHERSLSCVCGTSNTYGFAPNGDIEIHCTHHQLATYPPIVQAEKVGCPGCSYNSKYGAIYCKEHRGW